MISCFLANSNAIAEKEKIINTKTNENNNSSNKQRKKKKIAQEERTNNRREKIRSAMFVIILGRQIVV